LHWYDGGGTLQIIDHDLSVPSFVVGDSIGFTIEGTGTSTYVRYWVKPTNNVPYDAANWDSSSDSPDLTIDTSGWSTYFADTGTYIGGGSLAINQRLDDWYGGSTCPP
jgi:hypothetical protein